ncbi:MAG TPA: nucleoside phosphorylase [Bradyrhizobium sp.]
MSKAAWYIGCKQEDVGDSAILIGDPARIGRIAKHLDKAKLLEEKRGLRTVTGERNGRRITATAFGMGAPIATIVLHELFDLGVRTFLRIGTAQTFAPAKLADFVLAEGALRAEGTSGTYVPINYPAVADFALGAAVRARLARSKRPWHSGIFGTYDGFYSQMFGLSEGERKMIDALRHDIERYKILATDMETSALLAVGRVLGARVCTLCMGTVDGWTQEYLPQTEQAKLEPEMFEIALDSLANLPPME